MVGSTKIVILAGGRGTRLAEETDVKPKPMVEIGERPILWHIMKHYAAFGCSDFTVALGYKGSVIKRYFVDEVRLAGDLVVHTGTAEVSSTAGERESWRVELVETGDDTATGGRLKRLAARLAGGTFMATYGDGVGNVPIDRLLQFHRSHGRLATVTAVRPPARFGGIVFDGDMVREFSEKPQIGEGWINGGFMVLEPAVLKYIAGDESSLEAEVLEQLARDQQLAAFRHEGFWQCVDTLRELRMLRGMWDAGEAPWKVWRD